MPVMMLSAGVPTDLKLKLGSFNRPTGEVIDYWIPIGVLSNCPRLLPLLFAGELSIDDIVLVVW
jgi:hypothetical protein